jgi:hypothetical protein
MQHLIDINISWLRQALVLMEETGEAAFTSVPRAFSPHRASAHLRHILEFYECFLDGADSFDIDYDARRRDESIERSVTAAATRIRTILGRLESTRAWRSDAKVRVRMEDAPIGVANVYVASTIGRELQVLSSHTIHHFALIAMTLRAHGIEIDPSFGMAPSTLRHQEMQRETKAA